jgi:hypothetical protein
MRLLLALRLGALLLATQPAWYAATDSEALRFFETKIRPVLAARCFACHSSQAPKVQGGLLLDTQAGLRKGGNSGAVIDAAQPERSLLLRALHYQEAELKMPPGKPLAPELIADFETWVRSGAPMPDDAAPTARVDSRKQFWSFQAPKPQAVPAVQHAELAKNEIDNFVLAKLEAKNMAQAAPADKRTLIRRATYDLTGLPATASETDAFAADSSPQAYEHLVDRLLASPRYGERWGRYWLDIARYSDSRNVGDRFAYSYTYRDWVIRAINEDMPYDRFLKLQLAADLLPKQDRRDLAALGFLSLGREFPKSFPETVDDRIDTVARGMIGLTVACARCHDHKYDPIPTKDYYSMYSIFSNVREPKNLPLLETSVQRKPLDQVWEPRLDKIRKTDAEYRVKRNAEMTAFFKTQIADYLMAVRDSSHLSNTGKEELVRDRQLNLHLLGRWSRYISEAKEDDPIFGVWKELAELKDADFVAKCQIRINSQAFVNPHILDALQKTPPVSLRDAANRIAAVLMQYDKPEPLTGAEEQLRLVLRSPNAPVNVPVSEFELIYTEGDGNNTAGFKSRYESTRAMYAYAGAAPRAMAVEDVPSPKITHVFIRGNQNNPGAEAPPHFLSCLSKAEPTTFTKGSGRLELAEAIADPGNPLTARVLVNRVWMHHFGQGIVRSPSDFGLRGDAPTHPELLDYLAIQFMKSGWSLKKLHRTIMLSATYRQSSVDNPEARKVDPENLLLWRMNRQRLDIEALRDSLLAASGELNLEPGGPPFSLTAQPVVPRRTAYGFVERGRVPGFLSNFDFASPDTHAPMRFTTTVPQQALFLLNSSFVAEQAQKLAARAKTGTTADRIQKLYRSVFGRAAREDEVAVGSRYIEGFSEGKEPDSEVSPWQYGFGDGKLFTQFRYFVGDAWQHSSMLPDPICGTARLRPTGGEPGGDTQHAVVRRWVSPVSGKIAIEGTLKHNQSAVPAGDGVHARIVSSRHGELASWTVNGTGAEAGLSGITVEKGDTIDFIVDGREDTENDAFNWAPKIHLAGSETRWDAAKEFRGPAAAPLGIWERYAQVLLETNEFAFVD